MIDDRTDPKKWSILLIEDDLEFAGILKIRLSREKDPALEITLCSSLEESLTSLETKTYDLILLDLMLPDSSGIETFEKIKTLARHIPVVILSGIDNDEIAINAVRRGAEDYLVKSDISSKLLSRVIHHAIDRHRIKEKLASVTSRLRETNLRLEKMALLDPLTELYNRRGLQQILSREIGFAAHSDHEPVALLLDIDDFKKINDTLGHPVGDLLLKEIAQRVRESVRALDHVARIGGDEFIILLPDTRLAEAVHLAERIRLAISDTKVSISETETLKITASMGLAALSTEIASVDELLSTVDPLLRKSKREGKNRVCYDVADHPPQATGDATFSEKLTSAMRRGAAFFSLKQPIMDLSDLSVVGYEFLSRLKDESVCMPNDFFKAALEHNMLTLVDHHCFRSCINAAAALPPNLHRHINLFPATIIDLTPEKIVERLSTNCPAKSYCFEISEQQILGDPSYLIGPVESFRRFGISIAVDDVGFGNTCLESLILLEPDVIKLDKKFIRGSASNSQTEKTLRRVLKVAEDLNAEVIAEGIETKEDLALLKELGVKYGQGFYLGIPA